MSDDQPGFLIRHPVDAARYRTLAASPAEGVALARRTTFHSKFKDVFRGAWAWSPDDAILAAANRERHHDRALSHGLSGEVRSLAWSPANSPLATVELDARHGHWAVQIRTADHEARILDFPHNVQHEGRLHRVARGLESVG